MTAVFEARTAELREMLLMMAGLVGRNLDLAIRALIERSDELAAQAEENDEEVDRLEVLVDNRVVAYISTQAPVASECRYILSASRICSDLERVGDQATTIARRAAVLNAEPPLPHASVLMPLAEMACEMLQEAVAAFAGGDAEAAVEIVARDRALDNLHRELVGSLTDRMVADPRSVVRGVHLLTAAKCLERVGDHAANIAEDVFFVNRGEDIRHALSKG